MNFDVRVVTSGVLIAIVLRVSKGKCTKHRLRILSFLNNVIICSFPSWWLRVPHRIFETKIRFPNCLLNNKVEETVFDNFMATCSVRQIEHQPFSAFILLLPDGCLVSATISCWEMMWSTSHEHGTKKKSDSTTEIESLSPGSTDKDCNPVPGILNPRRVLDFYLHSIYLSICNLFSI